MHFVIVAIQRALHTRLRHTITRMAVRGARFLLPALLRIAVLPCVVGTAFTACLTRAQWYLHVLVQLVCFPAIYYFRCWLAQWSASRQASALGARDIPRVEGRLPLNIDVLLDWARSGRADEVGWMMRTMRDKYGSTYNTRVLGEDQIISMDPAVLNHVLLHDFDNFIKGPKLKDRAQDFLGDGIFNVDGDQWKLHRNLTRPFFHQTHVTPLHFAPQIQAFLETLPQSTVDMQAHLGELALVMAVRWMCGESVKHIDPLDLSQLGDALREAQRVVATRVKIGTVWPLFEITHDPLRGPVSILRAFFGPLITVAYGTRGTTRPLTCLLDRLVDVIDDPKVVEDQLINILLAARDTTSALLTFSVYILSLDETVYERVRNETLEMPDIIDRDAVRDARVTRAFINEVLRLFPPIPLKRTARSTLLPSRQGLPLFMPAGTSIILATILMQRSPEVFGPDADDFNIDRWLRGGLPDGQREAFMAWSAGPRTCLGQTMALTIAHTFIALWIRHLEACKCRPRLALSAYAEDCRMPPAWRTAAGQGRARNGRDRVWVVADVVLTVKGGLWVDFMDIETRQEAAELS